MEVDRVKFALISAILTRVWCAETASPESAAAWSSKNPAWGQSAVTALVIHEMFGGWIMRAEVENHGSHYYNVLPDGNVCDLTKGQFPYGTVIPKGEEVPRERLLCGERARAARTQERYALLLSRFVEVFLG